MRISRISKSSHIWLVCSCIAMLAPAMHVANGQGLTYDDAFFDVFANSGNIAPTSGTLADAFDFTSDSQVSDDNKWGLRGTAAANRFGADGTVFESNGAEDAPELVQTVSGLTSGTSYDLYAVWWSANSQNWTLSGGPSSNPGGHPAYDRLGTTGTAANLGIFADWSVLPPDNLANPSVQDGRTGVAGATLEGDRVMLYAKVATATANGSGEVQVFIDDVASPNRSWYDGVAYAPAGTSVNNVTATIDRTTGNLTINSVADYSIDTISINSAGGALDSTAWTTITGNLDSGGNSSFDSDAWEVTSMTANSLAEIEVDRDGDPNNGMRDVDGGTFGPGGVASINFGNVWVVSPFEDVQVNVTLNDGNFTVPISVEYVGGTPLDLGDFDTDGDIDVDDYTVVLRGLNQDLAGMTDLESYAQGDVTGDQLTNYEDLVRFREIYDDANGAGAFAALAGVPEPSSIALLILVGIGGFAFRGTRQAGKATGLLLAVVVLCFGRSTEAQITYVDADLQNDPSGNVSISGGSALASGNLGDWTIRGTSTALGGTDRTFGNNGDILQALFGEEVDELQIDFTIPTAGDYDIYAFYWDTDAPRLWNVAAGFTSGNLTDFNQDTPGSFRVDATTQVSGGSQEVLGLNVLESGSSSDNFADFLDNDRRLWATRIGTQTVSAGGNVTVYFDHFTDGKVNDQRTFFDGVGYGIAPPEVTLEVNTTTGEMTILNPRADAVDFSYYEITSAGSSLNPTGWNSLDAQNVDAVDGDDPGTVAGDSLLEGWDVAGSGGSLDGDLDSSGSVDGADLTEFESGYDSTYDGSDFLAFQRDFGQSGSGAGSPEILNEVNFLGQSTLAAMTGSLSLGNGYDTSVDAQDLVFNFGSVDNQDGLSSGRVKYVTGGSVGAVPEPTSALIAIFGLMAAYTARRRS